MGVLQDKSHYVVYAVKVACCFLGLVLLYGLFQYLKTGGIQHFTGGSATAIRQSIVTTSPLINTFKDAKPNKRINVSRALAGEFDMKIEPNPEFIGLNVTQAATKLFKHVQNFTAKCKTPQRLGKAGDGGYWMCMDEPIGPKKSDCLVYSFGIRDEWSFDDAVHDILGCEVHSFDPSMEANDHKRKDKLYFHKLGIWDRPAVNDLGWKLTSLTGIIKMLGHQDRVIDYLKIDVEGAEWPMLKEMLAQNSAKNVKQMIFEIHTPRFKDSAMTVADYGQTYRDLSELQTKLDFRLWAEYHLNGCCGRFAKFYGTGQALCCSELFYVNSKFLHLS